MKDGFWYKDGEYAARTSRATRGRRGCKTTGCEKPSPVGKHGSNGAYCKGCRVMRKRAVEAGKNPDVMTWHELNTEFWDMREKSSNAR